MSHCRVPDVLFRNINAAQKNKPEAVSFRGSHKTQCLYAAR